EFEGNTKYRDSALRKKLTSKVGEPLDEQKLFVDAREIEKRYEQAGYAGTQVKYVLSLDQDAGRGTATFVIEEKPRIRIARVEFVGATAFSQRELRRAIKTRRHWLLSWITRGGVFREEDFEDDKERLAEFYRSKGYIDFELRDVRIEPVSPGKVVVRLFVHEGQQYRVGSIQFTGNEIFSDEEIAEGLRRMQPRGVLIKPEELGPNGLKMDVGDVFTPQGYLADIQQIEDFYGAQGYIDVARNLNVARIPNTERGTMDLEFRIQEGQRSFIEKIRIRGNTKTKDRVIRRELAVAPGEPFDMVRIRRSRHRLEGLQYFVEGSVEARPEPTDTPYRPDLVISVQEKNTGNLMAGAGFSSIDALVGFAEITQGNFDLFNPPRFTGGGQKFRLRMQLGTQRQDYLLTFIEPWFLGRHLQLALDLYHQERHFLSVEDLYDETRTGGRIGITRALGSEFLIGSFGYRIENVGIDFNGFARKEQGLPDFRSIPERLLIEEGDALLSKIDLSLAVDTRNSPTLPDKGQRTEFSIELAGPFGGEKDYYKAEVRTHWYFRGLFSGHVLEVLGGTGVADAFGRTDVVPFYDRYYLGGLYSMRGYRFRSVSPREEGSREPIGGDTYWFGSVEYSLPLIERLRFAVFYDVGNVMESPYTYDFDNFNDNWGIGLRLNLPIGPLRLDYGFPIHHDRFNSGSGRFQFGVGFERPF
ncbi:MAG TPA: outer membrane protein assembly factor BamA, partial [Verrucomicrobiota bacterium]|nr:outer membrane protein assembly factor BamA [Verrucomicrobiota bacterium]